LEPRAISFDEAILVAVVGLAVNLISARMLHHSHGHGPDADHNHHHHQDHNLRAAYLHVLADALTSVLAIVALLTGKYFNWVWMDPMMGIVGAVVIGRWCYGLFRDTGRILLDGDVDEEEAVAIQQTIEVDADNRVTDLHVWRVGPGHFAVIVSVVTHFPKPPEYYKKLLAGRVELVHVTVEVHACSSDPCLPVQSSA
jgi:cation diffusion facilitator family transporter